MCRESSFGRSPTWTGTPVFKGRFSSLFYQFSGLIALLLKAHFSFTGMFGWKIRYLFKRSFTVLRLKMAMSYKSCANVPVRHTQLGTKSRMYLKGKYQGALQCITRFVSNLFIFQNLFLIRHGKSFFHLYLSDSWFFPGTMCFKHELW